MADADGGNLWQVSHDEADAENRTAAGDGRWVVYASGHLQKLGIWRVRPDSTDAARVVAGNATNPEVSPDGRYTLSAPTTRLCETKCAWRRSRRGSRSSSASRCPTGPLLQTSRSAVPDGCRRTARSPSWDSTNAGAPVCSSRSSRRAAIRRLRGGRSAASSRRPLCRIVRHLAGWNASGDRSRTRIAQPHAG
jgi:hypothetical protein